MDLSRLSPGTATVGESRSLLLATYRKGELEERVKAGEPAERGKVHTLATTVRTTQPYPQLEFPFNRDFTQRPCHRRAASATSVHTALRTTDDLIRARARQSLSDVKYMRAEPRMPKNGLSGAPAPRGSERQASTSRSYAAGLIPTRLSASCLYDDCEPVDHCEAGVICLRLMNASASSREDDRHQSPFTRLTARCTCHRIKTTPPRFSSRHFQLRPQGSQGPGSSYTSIRYICAGAESIVKR